jgi:hypothetical protein
MSRITKKKLDFTKESMLEILQECYNETHNIRTDTILLLNKWKPKASEIGDIAMIGKQIIDLIDKREKILGKKVEVVKIMKDIIYNDIKLIGKAEKKDSDGENTDLYSFAEELKQTIKDSKLKGLD